MKSDPFSEYEVIRELGRGSFAVVRLVKHKLTGVIRAMKAIRKTDD
jgi:serine/threonine protein kinase